MKAIFFDTNLQPFLIELPEKPENIIEEIELKPFPSPIGHQLINEYNEQLSKAKLNGIPFKDKEEISKIVLRQNYTPENENVICPDTIYEIPNLEDMVKTARNIYLIIVPLVLNQFVGNIMFTVQTILFL